MRILPVSLLFVLLAGCAGQGMFAPEPQFSAPGRCGALAQQRLEDARMAGLADGHERAIFENTYQTCLKQEAR